MDEILKNSKQKDEQTSPAEAEPKDKKSFKQLLKSKKFWMICACVVAVLAGTALLLTQLFGKEDAKNVITLPDGTKKTLTLEETGYTGIAADVITSQTFDCKPRNEHEGYRTDRTLVVDYKDPNIIYISVEYKGIFKTTDGGKTWHQKTKGIKVYARKDDITKGCYSEYPVIRMDPSDHMHLVAGLSGGGGGFLDATTPNSQTGGVYQTYDGGETWKLMINNKMNFYVTDVVFDKSNPKTVYYSTASWPASWEGSDQSKLYVTKGLIYKTADSGKSWTELPTGIGDHTALTTVLVNTQNGKEIVGTTFSATRLSADGTGTGVSTGKDSSMPQLGILKSTDGGSTWKKLPLPYTGTVLAGYASENNFNHMLFVTGTLGLNSGPPVSHITLDGGQTFKETMYINVACYDPFDPTGNHVIGYSNTASTPTIPNLNLFESNDGGQTWKGIGTLPKEIPELNAYTQPSKIVWHPTDKNTLYMSGGNGHIWKTTDLGKTWTTLLSRTQLPD